MRIITLIAVTIVAVACVQQTNKATPDTTGTPVVNESQHVVARRAAPDTLFATDGYYCIVRPTGKWSAADSGKAYDLCAWQAPDSTGR